MKNRKTTTCGELIVLYIAALVLLAAIGLVGWLVFGYILGIPPTTIQTTATEEGQTVTFQTQPDNFWTNEQEAEKDCKTRTQKYYGINAMAIHAASSTSSDFSTYDCYAYRFTKIP